MSSGSCITHRMARVSCWINSESGFRPINDAALENGDTLYGSSAQGVSVATWVDDDGYRMSLVLRAAPDSLRKLIRRVR